MKKLIALVLGFVVFAVGSLPVMAAFTDDVGNSYYSQFAHSLQEEGVVNGYGDGSFGYELNVNRAEMLKIIMLGASGNVYADNEEPIWNAYMNESCFDDVEANVWYTPYVCYAKEKGWIDGYADNTFKPEQTINTVEALKLLLQSFDIEYEETDIWYKGIVEKASEYNVIPLKVESFGQMLTRSEMASMVVRMQESLGGNLELLLGYLANYAWTYEMLVNEDVFVHHISSSVDEDDIEGSGVSLKGNFDIDYFVLSDCGGANCFIEKFDKCEPMNATFAMFETLIYSYEILGVNDEGLCEMNQYFEVAPTTTYIGAEMVCAYDYLNGFDAALIGLEASDCTGGLADIMYNGLETD